MLAAPFSIQRIRALLLLLLLSTLSFLTQTVAAWPYVDCSGSNPIFSLAQFTAHYNPSNHSIGLQLDGNFTNAYWAQGYTATATNQWRTTIQATIMGTQLYRSDGPACAMIIGGCPTAPGPGTLRTSFNISQSAPFAELMVSIQIVGSNQQTIVCAAVLLEQTMASVNTAIGLLPLALAAYSGGISLAATIMRAAIGNGFLGAVATYGLASEAISVHTPGFFDIIFYTQFILMTGQLAINYPSFYSTFTALFHWSFLGFKDSLAGKGPANATFVLTYGGAGSVNQINSPLNGSWSSARISNNINHDNNKRSMSDLRVSPLPAVAEYFIHDLRMISSGSPLQRQQVTPMISLWKRQANEPSTPATNTPPTSPYTSPHLSPQTSPPTSPPTTPTSSATSTKSSSSKSSRSTSKSSSSSMRPATDPGAPALPSSTAALSSPTVIVDIPVSFTNMSTSVPHNISRFGVEAYAAAIGAYPSKLFLGTLINAALAVVASLVLSGILLVVAWVMAKGKHQKGKTLHHAANFITGNMVRVWCLLYTPLALTAMYQLTMSGGAAMIVVAAISILVISVGATIFFTWRVLHAAAKFLIFDDQATLLKYGTLYNTLTEEGTLFFLVTLLVRFLWGLVISMLSSFGIAQVSVLIVVELGYILVIAVKWPFSESSDNKFHLFLGVIRIVITGCGLAYIHELQASPEVRQLFGYIQMALHLAVFIVVFALAIWNTIQFVMFWRSRHADSWRGPTKTYNFEEPTSGDETTEHGWAMANRPNSNSFSLGRGVEPGGSDNGSMDPLKGHRFTVQSNSSVGSMRAGSTQHNAAIHHRAVTTHNDSSDDEALRYISPAERYRQSRLSDLRRERFATESDAESAILDRRTDALLPPSSSAAVAITARASAAASATYSQSSSCEVDGLVPGKEPGDLLDNPVSGPAGKSTHRESYANIQRMSHQQPLADPRARRMSDIMRDGPHLYRSQQDNHDNEKSVGTLQMMSEYDARKPGLWATMKGAIGNALSFGKRPRLSGNGSSSKPKAFEVIRPLRPNYAEPASSSFNRGIDALEGGEQGRDVRGQQTGDEQLRELNSLGISRFFQESDRGYEKNRNLFVANPESRISRNGSMASTLSGALPPFSKLSRNGSNTGVSIKSMVQGNRSGERGSGSGLTAVTIPSVPTALASGVGAGSSSFESHSVLAGDRLSEYTTGLESSSVSEQDTASESRRISVLSAVGGSGLGMRYGRGSVESNIAEALLVDTPPLRLQGGGILKVSKGPEKSVKYWHKESGQYIESKLSNAPNLSTTTSSSLSSASPSPLLSGIVTLSPVTARIAASGTNMTHHKDSILDNSNRSVATISRSSPISSVSVRVRSSVTPLIVVPATGSTSSPTTVSSPRSPESPGSLADSQQSGQSNNILASAGRMHEILGRMFSGHQQDIDESDSMSEDTCSTFSGRASGMSTAGTRSTPKQRTDVHTGSDFGQDVFKSSEQQYDILEPVYEASDDDDVLFLSTSITTSAVLKDRVSSAISSLASSTSNSTIQPLANDRRTPPAMNTGMGDAPDFNTDADSSRKRNHVHDSLYTIPRHSHSKDSSEQPSTPIPLSAQLRSSCSDDSLAQSPLQDHLLQNPTPTNTPLSRQPSLQSSRLDYLYFTDLNRNSSVGTTMTSRTDDSYVTAQSHASIDDN